jgi:hypothetical protein
LKNNSQEIFKYTAYAVVVCMLYYIKISVEIYNLTNQLSAQKGITDMPDFSKIFWIPIASAFALFAFKRQLYNITVPCFIQIAKDQHDQQMVEERANKSALALYKLCVYMGTSMWGYIILKDSEIMPWFMGGSGSLVNCFTNLPYQTQIPGLIEFSLFQMGYFIEDIINHVFFKERSSDFWEMNLHHFITLTLYGGMIL